MPQTAKDLMTPDPQCCTVEQTLNDVAKIMVECNCGEIPVVDTDKKIAQADVARKAEEQETGELVRAVSR